MTVFEQTLDPHLTRALVDVAEARHALSVLTTPGQVVELRILQARTADSPRYAYQASGYFNDPEALVRVLTALRSAKGVYITLHPCQPDLLARAHNRLRTADEMRKAAATSDLHITALRWLPIDIDPERPADISSTEEEHQAALAQAQRIKTALQALGWPNPVEADSGNGAHLLYPIDLPVAEGSKNTGLLHRILRGLAEQFDLLQERKSGDPFHLHVDQTVCNPSRIWKLYGTLACKGDHTAERPHRMARLLSVPEQLELVPRDLLEAVAAPLPEQQSVSRSSRWTGGSFDLEHWIHMHQLDVTGPTDWQGGKKWVFPTCPWNTDHTDRSAYVVQQANGAIAAGCHHQSCTSNDWKALRALYEPVSVRGTSSSSARRPTDTLTAPAALGNGGHGASAPPTTGSLEPPGDLPEIFINSEQLREMVDQAVAAIMQQERHSPSLFLQSARLVRVGRNELGRPLLAQMGVAELKEMLTHAANFYRLKKVPGSDGGYEKVPVSPPNELAEQILARQTQEPYLPFPALEGIVETPVFRRDGSLLHRPGYDTATHLYYTPHSGMEACRVSQRPTHQEREQALALLWSAIGEFPYVSEADKANALGLLLTPLLRPAIKRHVPLALLDAPKQGTGKGLLSDVVSLIATGESAAILTFSDRDEEVQKAITALLLEGTTMITIDNIAGRLQSKHLDAVLTSDTWRGRILGVSKMTSVPQRATWIATGNNIRLGGDLGRRCYRIRLDAKVSRPFMRKGFTHSDLAAWVVEHRTDLVSALLTLARAWFVAGKPQDANLPSLATFTGWVQLVGGILAHAGVSGFLSNLEQLYEEADEENTQWEAFLRTWIQEVGEGWVPLSQVVQAIFAAQDTGDVAGGCDKKGENSLMDTLPELLQTALKERPRSFIVRLGKALDKRVDACFGLENVRLEKRRNVHHKTSEWRVLRGVRGVVPTATREKNLEDSSLYKGETVAITPRTPRKNDPNFSQEIPPEGLQRGVDTNSHPSNIPKNSPKSKQPPAKKGRRFAV